MKKLLIHLFLLFLTTIGFAQQPSKDDLQKQKIEIQKELQKLKAERQIVDKEKNVTIGDISKVDNSINKRESLIENIKGQVYYIEKDMNRTYREIDTLKKEMDTLKAQYAKSIIYAYKNRSNYDFLNFLFSASNFNDAFKRLQYLKTYRQYREMQAGEIKKTKQKLEEKVASLTGKRVEKNGALTEQNQEVVHLEEDKQEKAKKLASINARQGEIAQAMRKREAQSRQIDVTIRNIIKAEIAAARKADAERRRLAAIAEKKRLADIATANKIAKTNNGSSTNPASTNPTTLPKTINPPKKTREISPLEQTPEVQIVSNDFKANQHNLPWPVEQGTIFLHFGDNLIPASPRPIHIHSDGVSIETSVGAPVKSIFDGEVISVFELPGSDRSTVLIQHGKYFTAYSNLINASVSKGQKVSRGTVLGKADENEDGRGQVDLKIGDEKINFNPEQWIRRK